MEKNTVCVFTGFKFSQKLFEKEHLDQNSIQKYLLAIALRGLYSSSKDVCPPTPLQHIKSKVYEDLSNLSITTEQVDRTLWGFIFPKLLSIFSINYLECFDTAAMGAAASKTRLGISVRGSPGNGLHSE